MDDTIEGGKELLAETVHAFKTGLQGDEYVPGEAASHVHEHEELTKLRQLHAAGTLTDEEFENARARLAARPG